MRPGSSALDRPGIALLLVAVALLSTAGAIGLLEPTETRYAEIAREMRASGDYLVPHLNAIPHYHKPPLAYWATAAGFAALGENSWGARIPAVLASLLTLALAARVARRRFAGLGIPAGLAVWTLGTSILFFLIGRSVSADPFLATSVIGFWAAAGSPLAPLALGLGFLAKGPVVLVPTVLPVLVAAAWGRERASLRWLGPRRGWALFAAAALPWYLAVVARTPGLADYFLTHQIWERYATTEHRRGGPVYYFVGVLAAGALPWTAAMIAGVVRLWRERSRSEARLLLCWLFAPLVFFSFSGSKLPAYLLPTFGAVSMLAAVGLANAGRAVRWTTAATLAALAAAGWTAGPQAFGRLTGGTAALPAAAHVGLACLAYAATWVARARPAPGALLALLGLTALTVAVAPYEGPLGSPRPLARILAENREPGEPVVEFGRFTGGLPFYLGEPVRLLEVSRDTVLRAAPPRAPVFMTRDSLASLAAAHRRVWILGPEAETRSLGASLGLGYERIARWRRLALGFVSR